MWDWKVWCELLREILREFRFLVQHEVERFTFALENWVNYLVTKPLPADWRRQTAQFLLHWESEGYKLTPRSMVVLEWWIETWAKKRGFWPPREAVTGSVRFDGGLMTVTETVVVGATPEADDSAVESSATTSEPKHSKLPANWPGLTHAEAEAAQASTGLPWWFPMQPRNRNDGVWQRQMENLGRVARDRLLAFYREVAALGRMARAIKDHEEVNLDPLSVQRQRVQEAYDQYIQQRTEVHRAWTRYLTTEWFIGPEVVRVFGKIDNGLPDRIEGFESPFDETLKAARQAGHASVVKKRERTEMAYTAVVWADTVITAIEIASLVGSAKAVVRKTFEKAIAQGLSRAAARKVAIAYGVAHIATAAASAAAVGGVLPEVLAAAGLDEAEVRAGLAVFRAFFTIVGIRAVGKPTGPRSTADRSGGTTPPRKFKRLPKQKKLSPEQARLSAGHAFNRAQASKYPYNEIRIVRPDGGKPVVLDSYDPVKGEIVFRRNTQFSEIGLKSAIAYLNEFVNKYPPGRTIANVPSSKDLAGQELKGTMFFEVPPQWKAIPLEVLQAAKARSIKIRDSNGKKLSDD